MKRRKMWMILLAGAVVAIGAFLLIRALFFAGVPSKRDITVGNTLFHVEVADTMALRARGLSGHTPLTDTEGMLFIFPTAGSYGFWMKDMTFGLDFVWIGGDKVVGVTEQVPPPGVGTSIFSLTSYYPPSAVIQVLEINAGLVAKYGIRAGDKVE